MAISELYAVTETVSTTEWSFTTDTAGPDADTTDGHIQGFFDLNALAAGDEFQFKVYEKIASGGTQRLVYQATLVGVQAEPLFVTPMLVLMHGWDMTWKKISGTDRSIIGSIRSLNADDVAAVKTVVDAVKVKTDYLPSATAGAAGGVFIAGANAATTVNITGNVTGNLSGSVGSVTGAVGSVTGAVGSVTGAVGSVTGLTAADVAAIKAKTDSLTFTVANTIDANVQTINEVAVIGAGTSGDKWRA